MVKQHVPPRTGSAQPPPMNNPVQRRSAVAVKALRRIRANPANGFTASAVAAVALPYALLFPLVEAGWLGVPGFVLTALILSTGAMMLLGHRLSKRLRRSI